MADHETNDSIDRGHDDLNPAIPSASSRDRSTWSRRLEIFDNAPREALSFYSPNRPEARRTSSAGRDHWETISSGASTAPSARAIEASDRSGLTAETAPPQWPDPDGLDFSLAAARRESADRSAEISGLRSALGAAHQQLRARETEIADLSTRLSVALATAHARQEELHAATARRKGIEEKLAAIEREVSLARDKLQRSVELAEKRESQIESLRATQTTLEETLYARERVIAARDEELAAREQELQAVRLRLAAQQKSIVDRDAEMAILADQLLTEQERARALEAEIGGREQSLENQRGKLVERDEQLASLLATLDVVERTLARRPSIAEFSKPESVQTLDESSEATALPLRSTPPQSSCEPLPELDFGHTSDIAAKAPAPSEADAVAHEPAAEPSDRANAEVSDRDSQTSEPFVVDASVEEASREEAQPDNSIAAQVDDAPEVDSQAGAPSSSEVDAIVGPSETPIDASDDDAGAVDGLPDKAVETAAIDTSDSRTESPQGVEPGSAFSRRFEAELHELEACGDLFVQRPPPSTPMFRWWRDHRIQNTVALFAASFDDLVVGAIARECEERGEETIRVLSLCGADPELELRVGRALVERGHENFAIDCIDDRESWHDVRADFAAALDLSDKIDSRPANDESLASEQTFDIFLADGSLPHLADLHAFFERIKQAWKDGSVLVVSAPLAPSAASATPELVEVVDRIWNVMPDHYMQNQLTGEAQLHFTPSDPPSDAAGAGSALSPATTPLLPLLLDRYIFEVFAVYGNLINAYLGPEIGPNFDPSVESDRSFIERFSELDEAQINSGAIHPLHMVALVRSSSIGNTVMIENRAPERCLMLENATAGASED